MVCVLKQHIDFVNQNWYLIEVVYCQDPKIFWGMSMIEATDANNTIFIGFLQKIEKAISKGWD